MNVFSKRLGCGFVSVGVITGKRVVMHHMWTRVVSNLFARVSGPLKFRLVLQPAMAAFLAIRCGLADAKTGKPPYFWALCSSEPGERADLIRDGWKNVGKVFLLALLLDVVYQLIVMHFIYPGEAIIVAFILAIVPYLILRGLVMRLARRRYGTLTRPANAARLGHVR